MAGEVVDINSLVRESADRVLLAMNGETFRAPNILGSIAAALSVTEGMEVAHEYTENVVNTLDMQPGEKADTWIKLYALGDTAALKPARRAIGLAGEDVPFVEAMGAMELSGLHSAERTVALAVAGDTEMIPIARRMAERVYTINAAGLLSKLYIAGDKESLDVAIAAAEQAAEYCEQTGDMHYDRSESALKDMALFAAKQGDIDDALKLLPALKSDSSQVLVHVELYKQGVESSKQAVAAYLRRGGTMSEHVEHEMATAGYRPAERAIKRRLHRDDYGWSSETKIQDMLVLMGLGNTAVASRFENTIHQDRNNKYYTGYLLAAGMQRVAADIAKAAYADDPTEINAVYLWEADPTLPNWQTAFDKALERSDSMGADYAAGLVRSLAQHRRQVQQ